MTFKDHFSGHATGYAQFRPHYPSEIFDAVASVAPARTRAWDVATGNGQAAVGLARHFAEVVATDASAEQIGQAQSHDRVRFAVGPAEKSGLAPQSVDAVVVAQALHWFDFEAFYAEARRVARPGAPIVAWCYEVFHIDEEIDAVVDDFYVNVVGPYWPAERAHIATKYANIPWPFERIELPAIAMTAMWRLENVVGYIGTWSAVQRYKKALGQDPMPAFVERLEGAWGAPDTEHLVTWPLNVLAGRL